MKRFESRILAVVGAGVLTVALTVGVGGPAVAAQRSGPITRAQDVLGVWLGELTGYQGGQEVDWQYRLTVRKAKGQAGVAWEEWRDCEGNEAACAAGKATGGGWGQPSRVLFAMDAEHVIHGVSDSGAFTGKGDATGGSIHVIMVCAGTQDLWDSATAMSGGTRKMVGQEQWAAFAVSGTTIRQPM